MRPKSALVTGGASGIGKAVAIELAVKHGYSITLVDTARERVDAVVAQIREESGLATARVCDLTSEGSQRKVFHAHCEEHGTLDLCLLNAGIAEQGDLFDPDNDEWSRVIQVNLISVLAGIRIAVHFMKSLGSKGTICVTGSDLGLLKCNFAPAYAAAKAGLIHFVHSMTDILQKDGIRLCAVNPPKTSTPLVQTGWFAIKEEDVSDPGIEVEKVVDAVMHVLLEPEKAGYMVFLERDGTLQRVAFPNQCWTRLKSL